jgi:hypothetical protein
MLQANLDILARTPSKDDRLSGKCFFVMSGSPRCATGVRE